MQALGFEIAQFGREQREGTGTIMAIQDIAEKLKSRVASGGFDRSVKFDTGADGVIVIDGASVSTTCSSIWLPTCAVVPLMIDPAASSGEIVPPRSYASGFRKPSNNGTASNCCATAQHPDQSTVEDMLPLVGWRC